MSNPRPNKPKSQSEPLAPTRFSSRIQDQKAEKSTHQGPVLETKSSPKDRGNAMPKGPDNSTKVATSVAEKAEPEKSTESIQTLITKLQTFLTDFQKEKEKGNEDQDVKLLKVVEEAKAILDTITVTMTKKVPSTLVTSKMLKDLGWTSNTLDLKEIPSATLDKLRTQLFEGFDLIAEIARRFMPVGMRNAEEASHRMHINILLIQAMYIYERYGPGGNVQVFTEWNFRAVEEKFHAVPSDTIYQFTGQADYMCVRTCTQLVEWHARMDSFFDDFVIDAVVIEAKTDLTIGDGLPQAIIQAILALSLTKNKKDDTKAGTITQLRFILTSANTMYFGVVDKVTQQYYCSQPLNIDHARLSASNFTSQMDDQFRANSEQRLRAIAYLKDWLYEVLGSPLVSQYIVPRKQA